MPLLKTQHLPNNCKLFFSKSASVTGTKNQTNNSTKTNAVDRLLRRSESNSVNRFRNQKLENSASAKGNSIALGCWTLPNRTVTAPKSPPEHAMRTVDLCGITVLVDVRSLIIFTGIQTRKYNFTSTWNKLRVKSLDIYEKESENRANIVTNKCKRIWFDSWSNLEK